MKRKGLRIIAALLAFCLILNSTIYAAEETAGTTTVETQTEMVTEALETEAVTELAPGGDSPEGILEPETTAPEEETEPETAAPEFSEEAEPDTVKEIQETEPVLTETEMPETEMPETEPESKDTTETESESETLILAAEAMAIALDPVATAGDGTEYDSLQDAIDNTESGTVTLIKNVAESITINGKTMTIDLQKHALSSSGNTVVSIKGGANVTIEHGTIDGDGKGRGIEVNASTLTGTDLDICNCNVSGSGSGIRVYSKSTATLTDVDIYGNTATGMSCKGGGLSVESSRLNGTNVNIYDNSCDNTFSSGGGLALTAATGRLQGSIYGNSARNGAGITLGGVDTGETFELEVDVHGNSGSTGTPDGIALYAASGVAKYKFVNSKIHGHTGDGTKTLINLGANNVSFSSTNIFENDNFDKTIALSGSSTFENCRIYENTAVTVAGISSTNINGGLVMTGTVITRNTATGTGSNAAGGLSVTGMRINQMNLDSFAAVYENHTASGNQANDIYIPKNNILMVKAANEMTDGDKSFTYFKWKDADGTLYTSEIHVNKPDADVCLTAVNDVPRFVAMIGDQKYDSLQAAVDKAGESDVIVLIAGEDGEDELGMALTSDMVTIDKPVTIDFNGRSVSLNEGRTLFDVAGTGHLTLKGTGTVKGEITSAGDVTLQGDVSADKYIHGGKSFVLDGPVGTVTVETKPDCYLTATANCAADAVNWTLDSSVAADFNDEEQETDDILLVRHDGTFDESVLNLQNINPLIAELINDGNEVKLHKSLLKGVFVGGAGADDGNPGLTTDKPVATLAKAVEILKKHTEFDSIWVLGEVEVSEPTTVDFSGLDGERLIKRHPSYDGILFHVNSSLDLANVTVDGMRDYMEGTTDTMFLGDTGSQININSGAKLQNNDVNKESSITLSEAEKAKGGAVRSWGTVVLDGGTVCDCNAYMGGGIYIHDGLFQMQSGTITGCTATGYMTHNEAAQVAAGGGVCVEASGRMEMTGGTIQGCSAGIGGGISLGGSYVLYQNVLGVESFVMNGGTIQNCSSRSNGGGLYVQGSYKATIGQSGKSHIQGNNSNSGNFGGGGIYVNSGGGSYENGRLQLYNAVIRNNTAGSPGGGLAGCNTSKTEIYLNNGGVFYQNTGLGQKDDILLSDSNGMTSVSAPHSFVSEYMLGGDPYFWKHVGSGNDYGVNYLHDDDIVKHMYTDAADGSDAINKALEKAAVFIESNTSSQRGGGIGSNGDVILGTDDTETTEISVTKVWDDDGYDEHRPDEVNVWLYRDGEKVSCVEIEKAEDGTWPTISFTKLATGHEYMISEETTGMPAIYTSEVDPAEPGQDAYTVTNHINCGRLCIHKAVEGAPDASGTFRFKVYLEKDGAALTDTYPVRSSDGTESTAEFTDGIAEVEVADGGYLFIDDIPQGASATITELTTEGYVVYAGDMENPSDMVSECSGSIEAKLTEDLYFRNVYSHDNQLTLTKQTVTGTDMPYPVSRTFWFALYDDSGYTHRVSDIKAMTFDNAGSASVTFDGLLNNKTYYIAELDSEGNVINEGMNYLADGSQFTVSGGFSHLIGQEENAETIRNVIEPKIVEGYLGIPVTKTLVGRAADAKKDIYTFTLTGLDGAPVPAKTSATLTLTDAAESTFEEMFGAIPFTEAGTFVYEIREQAGEIGGITYDGTVYRVTIQVESFDTIDNETVLIPNVVSMQSGKDGSFTELDGAHTAAFANTYHAAPVNYSPVVKKTVTGDVPDQKTFTFTMEPAEAYDITMPENLSCTVTGSGTGTFGAMTFSEPGTYVFAIREQAGTDPGYTYDDTEYTLTLVVEDNLDGNLVVSSKTYQAGEVSGDVAAFTNVYTTTPTAYAPSVTKTVTGSRTPDDKTFAFQLACQSGDENGYEITDNAVTITGSGTAKFKDIRFTKPGTYVFTVTETTGKENGYTYDPSTHTLTVVVGDHDSILKVDSFTYEKDGEEEDAAVFTNTYGVTGTELSIPVEKKLAGDVTPDDKEFRFALEGEDKTGYEITDGSLVITGAGTGTFKPVRFTEAGTYVFEISEVAGTDSGYAYDDTVYTATVTVVDHDSKLAVDSVVYETAGKEADVVFTNTYTVTGTELSIPVEKKLSGDVTPDDKEFRFVLAGEDNAGYEITDGSLVITGAGAESFKPVRFTKAGTYTFQISEVAGTDNGYTYDDTVYTATVTVVDHDSRLSVDSVVYETAGKEADVVFTNTYTVTDTELSIPVEKKLTGDMTPDDKEFRFALTGEDKAGYEITDSSLVITGAGKGTFKPVRFTKAGTYVFQVSEEKGSDKGYGYDGSVYKATVTVTDLDSKLAVDSVVYEKDGKKADIVFTNTYAVTGTELSIPVEKRLEGDVTPDRKEFRFTLTGEDRTGYDITNGSLVITGAGKGTFKPVRFTKAGIYTFLVSEEKESDRGYSYDDSVYTVTVTVSDHDSSLAVDSVKYDADGEKDAIVFTNSYRTTAISYQPKVKKTVNGADPLSGEFLFKLSTKDTDGIVMPEPAEVVTGQGIAEFDAVTFTKAGHYSFEIREEDGALPGYIYSDAIWTLEVDVTDEDSQLVLKDITYQLDGQVSDMAEFVNTHLTGDLTVTKELTFEGFPIVAENSVFYVSLYSDKECTKRVSEVKELSYKNSSVAETMFDDLETGKPYYVGECDKNGNVLEAGRMPDGTVYQAVFADGNEVVLKSDKDQVQKKFQNDFKHIPKHYYYEGSLTITKYLQDPDGQPKSSYDVFYIGVFADAAHTTFSDAVEEKIIALPMNGKSSATVTVKTRTPEENGLPMYFAEVDMSGNLVQDGFEYDISMSDDTVKLTLKENHASVTITNTEIEETESETEPETDQETELETENSIIAEKETSGPVSSTQTGDETNLGFYLILFLISAGTIVTILLRKYKDLV